MYLYVIHENWINEKQNEKWQHCTAVKGTYVLDDTAVSTTVDNIT